MKISVITGSRSEFGLSKWVIKKIHEDSQLELSLLVTGMHLSPEFGDTFKEIEDVGFKIDRKIEILMSSDTSIGISKSVGLGIISFSEALEQIKPDLVMVLGDRFEIFSACIAANFLKIPIAHIHGGERTEGSIDESIRHSITKMSHFHFASTEEYRNRIIQLGENPKKVFCTGTPGIDSIYNYKLLNKNELESKLNFKLGKLSAVVTYHPDTLEKDNKTKNIINLLEAFNEFEDLKVVFCLPNADTYGRTLSFIVKKYFDDNPKKGVTSINLGQKVYLSAILNTNLVIGNSSSGIIEAPSFKKPTVNVGDRQKGRLSGDTVIHVNNSKKSIIAGIKKALSKEFTNNIKKSKNPYGDKGASERIVDIIKQIKLDDNTIKKEFFDMKSSNKQ